MLEYFSTGKTASTYSRKEYRRTTTYLNCSVSHYVNYETYRCELINTILVLTKSYYFYRSIDKSGYTVSPNTCNVLQNYHNS